MLCWRACACVQGIKIGKILVHRHTEGPAGDQVGRVCGVVWCACCMHTWQAARVCGVVCAARCWGVCKTPLPPQKTAHTHLHTDTTSRPTQTSNAMPGHAHLPCSPHFTLRASTQLHRPHRCHSRPLRHPSTIFHIPVYFLTTPVSLCPPRLPVFPRTGLDLPEASIRHC